MLDLKIDLNERYKTWPQRSLKVFQLEEEICPSAYEQKYKNIIMSLDIISDQSVNNQLLATLKSVQIEERQKGEAENLSRSATYGTKNKVSINSNIPLESALDSLPLVYNPSTKQLQVKKLKPKISHFDTHAKQDCLRSNVKSCIIPKVDLDVLPSRGESISSTKDDLNSTKSIKRKTDIDFPSADNWSEEQCCTYFSARNLTGENICCDENRRKKGISSYFSKNLFPWRSKIEARNDISNLSSPSLSESKSSKWKLFLKEKKIDNSTNTLRKVLSQELHAGTAGLIMEERPVNLPTKSPMELQKHNQDYENIISAAKKKELRIVKDKLKAQEHQLKLEQQVSDSLETRKTVILPNWKKMRNQQFCLDLWWLGLPSCIRGDIWKLAIGNDLNLTSQIYHDLKRRSLEKLSILKTASKLCEPDVLDDHVISDSTNHEATLKVINLDVSRTFPQLCIFQEGGPLHDPLHNILCAFVCYRPDVGYVQGMSFMAATLLLNMDEPDAFVYFANLILREPHLLFFNMDQKKMQAYYQTFDQILRETLPFLHQHLKSINVSPNMYFLDWILTVFARSFDLDFASRLWDIYLRDGEVFLFRASVGILKHCEKQLLSNDCTANVAQFLTRLPEHYLDPDAFFKDIRSVSTITPISKANFESILQYYMTKALTL